MALSSKIEFVPGIQTPNAKWSETENTWSSNSYLVLEGRALYPVDTGLGSLHRAELLKAVSRFSKADSVYLLNTHWHLDHSGNGTIVKELQGKFPEVHYLIPETAKGDMERFMERSNTSLVDMGLEQAEWLSDGRELAFSGVTFSGWKLGGVFLLSTPGHSPDSLSIYMADEKAIFTGDLLWYVNPNGEKGSIQALLQSIARIKSLVVEEGIEYLGQGHFQPISGRQHILDYISQYEEREKALVRWLEGVVEGDSVAVDYLLERLRESDHPAIVEALRINYPYYPSYLHRFIRVFLREKGWSEVDKEGGGTWSPKAPG